MNRYLATSAIIGFFFATPSLTLAGQQPQPSAVEPGKVLSRTARWDRPIYPPEATRERITGRVEVELVLGVAGSVGSVRATSGPETLRSAAETALRSWTFNPVPKGEPQVEVSTTIAFEFTEEFGAFYATVAYHPGPGVLPRPRFLSPTDHPILKQILSEIPQPKPVQINPMPVTLPVQPDSEPQDAPRPPILPVPDLAIDGPPSDGPETRSSKPTRPAMRVVPPGPRPKILTRPRPQFTRQAQQNSTGGDVFLRALFGADGTIKAIQVLRGLPDGLNQQAVEVVRSVRFEPARDEAGNPVDAWLPFNISFVLR